MARLSDEEKAKRAAEKAAKASEKKVEADQPKAEPEKKSSSQMSDLEMHPKFAKFKRGGKP